MSSKKTIKINPELFNLSGGNKTQKNREKKVRPAKATLINPNSIKKQLINRIKEHKNNENKSHQTKTQTQLQSASIGDKRSDKHSDKHSDKRSDDIGAFTDEFMDSINYLTSLSKEKKEIDSKENYERIIKEKRENFLRKTVKNPTIYNAAPMPYVELELPEELFPVAPPLPIAHSLPLTLNTSLTKPPINTSLNASLTRPADVPYGCLKNGLKPTYRTWQTTRKNRDAVEERIPIRPTTSFAESPTTTSSNTREMTDREKRLKILQEKMKRQNELEQAEKMLSSRNLLAQPRHISLPTTHTQTHIPEETSELQEIIEDYVYEPKKMIKKTIKRKYTLGKSAIKKQVGVLIKDNQTRKKIVNAQKDLKRKALNDVKSYLRDHGLIKVGSNAPNDVLRKIYESSMLTGDVVNNSKDVLLHNFLAETGGS